MFILEFSIPASLFHFLLWRHLVGSCSPPAPPFIESQQEPY